MVKFDNYEDQYLRFNFNKAQIESKHVPSGYMPDMYVYLYEHTQVYVLCQYVGMDVFMG
jgi:hypothetical protein